MQIHTSSHGLEMFPKIAQSITKNNLAGIDNSDVYIDDVEAFSTSWKTRLKLLDTILNCFKDTDLTVNQSSANGPSKKLTGLVIGSPHADSDLGKRKSMQSCTWTIHAFQLTFAVSSAVSIFIGTFGPAMSIFSNPSQIAWGWKRDDPSTGLMTCNMIHQDETIDGIRCPDCLPWPQ